MPLNRPILDDRSYEQLRNELIRRIPVYAPEWTDHNASDPGITLIELFSFLGENLLYRFNQIPDATYLEFLRLLQIPVRPAQPASALLTMTTELAEGVRVALGTEAKAGGGIAFETLNEVRVLPLSCLAVAKTAQEAPDPETEQEEAQYFEQAYKTVAGVTSPDDTAPYQSESVSEDASGAPVNFANAVDGMLWIALLAEDADAVETLKANLESHEDAPLLLNIGFVPDIRIEVEETITSPEFSRLFRCPGEGDESPAAAVEWQISTGTIDGDEQPVYRSLRVDGDTTKGLSQEGVLRLNLPNDVAEMGVFELDDPDQAGTGDLPPPLDETIEQRILFWLRAFRHDGSRFGKVVYVGTNAAELVQTRKARTEFLGTGTGQPNQTYRLINKNAVPGNLVLEVEEPDGWKAWTEVDGFHASGESEHHYLLDSEGGKVRFGNGLQGYAPQIGQRIRAKSYRYGGGIEGNVAAKAISKLTGVNAVDAHNPLAAYGGQDAEAIEEALERIPGELRRRDRAVTQGDFRELALMTPGARIGRAECLPRYHPRTPQIEAAGVVSVIVWPQEDAGHPNAPMPNRNQLRSVCQWLDARRLVTTELYVLPPEYRSIAVAIGLKVKPGYGIDAVRHWVELVIRQYLAPLPPYGPSGEGWPLGRRVHGPELEAAALQVEGVEYLEELKVVGWDKNGTRIDNSVVLEKNETPELIEITVEEGPVTVEPGEGIEPPDSERKPAVPIPVIREEC
jgi:hypothetical protein